MREEYRPKLRRPNQRGSGTRQEHELAVQSASTSRGRAGTLRCDLRHAAEIGFRRDLGLGMLGAPPRAGAAHVVPLGAVVGEQLRGYGAPEVGDGLADCGGFLVLGHDTFPSSRRVPTAGSAFWSRRRAAWFRGHDATQLVKIRYNFGLVVLLISDHFFRSFTELASTYALPANYAVRRITFSRGKF